MVPFLAPSPRVFSFLLQQVRLSTKAMALTTIEPPAVNPETFPPPPAVAVTPCDPLPRPYYLDGGLRRVQPYHFTYNTYCKERWRGRELFDIFSSEFRDRTAEYYVSPLGLIPVVTDRILTALERHHRNRQSCSQWQTRDCRPDC